MTEIDWPGVVLGAGASLVLIAEGMVFARVASRRQPPCRREDCLAPLLAQVERRAVRR